MTASAILSLLRDALAHGLVDGPAFMHVLQAAGAGDLGPVRALADALSALD
jgi:hypothetical protein